MLFQFIDGLVLLIQMKLFVTVWRRYVWRLYPQKLCLYVVQGEMAYFLSE